MAATGNPSPPSLRPALLRTGLLLGGIAAGVGATVTADGATWFGLRGPRCALGACLGAIACPGCGLLRSTARALHGDFAGAFAAHPTGIAVAALLLTGTLVHFDILRRRRELPAHRHLRRAGHWTFVLSLAAGWLFRLSSS